MKARKQTRKNGTQSDRQSAPNMRIPRLDALEPRILMSGDFDYALTSSGPVHVAQGHDMYVEIDVRTMGTNPNDRIVNMAATTSSPKIITDWVSGFSGAHSDSASGFYIGSGSSTPYTGATWIKISAAADAPLGASIVTVSATDYAWGQPTLPQHAVAPGINIIVDPAPTAPPTATFNSAPIPITPPSELASQRPDPVATWENQMTTNGPVFAANSYISTHGAGRGDYSGVWFYDGTRVFYQLGSYTGQQTLYQGAKSPASGAKGINTYYEAFAAGGLMGYEYFGQGIAMDYQHSASDPTQRTADFNALQQMVNLDGTNSAQNPTRMREVSYTIETYLAGKTIGCTVNDTALKFYVDNLLGQFDQDFVSRRLTGDTDFIVWNNIEPFMTGLASEALIDYYQYTVTQGTPDYRIPAAIKSAADWLTGQTWNTQTQSYQYNAWDPNGGDFYYMVTYPDGNVNNIAGSERFHVGDAAGGDATSDQELNFLYSDMFGFLYKTYGENNGSQYRVWGDKVFSYATLVDPWVGYGKGFSQEFRQSIDYVQARLNEPWSQAASAPVISNFQENALGSSGNSIVWTTSTPTSSEVNWGTSQGSLTNQLFNDNNWIMKNHSQEITGLTPGQTYYYRVIAKDANGQTTTSATRSFVAGASSAAAVVQVVATTPVCQENVSNGVFTLTRTNTTGTLTVNYTLGSQAGTQAAVNGTDYQTLSGSVTFANGSNTATVTVTPTNNGVSNPTRTVVLTLSAGTGYSVQQTPTYDNYNHLLALNSSATVLITDDENPIPTVTVGALDNRAFRTAAQATEFGQDQRGVWRISRTGSTAQALTVNYQLDPAYANGAKNGYDFDTLPGTATIPAGQSYVDVILTPHNNDQQTGLSIPTLDMALTPSITYLADPTAMAFIYLDSSDFSVEVSATQQLKVSPGTHGTFTITRVASATYNGGVPDYSYPITVNYTLGGTAVAGVDYTGSSSGSVTFAAGVQSINLDVAPIYPNCVNKTLTLTVTPSTGCLWAPHVPSVYADGDHLTGSATMRLDAEETGTDTLWVNDAIPAGSTDADYGYMYPAAIEAWNWVTSSPAPYSGTKAHQSSIAAGLHGSYFQLAPRWIDQSPTTAMKIDKGDWLYTYVYLDPANMPSELMLRFQSNGDITGAGWNHIVYWGQNKTGLNTDQAFNAGALPAGGAWVRLAVPASAVGMEGQACTGVAYFNYDGRATWDSTGKNSAVTSPAAPTNLTATVPSGMGKVNLSWTNNAGSGVATNIYRELDDGKWFLIGRTAPGATSFVDSGQGGQYWNNTSGQLLPVDGNNYDWNGNEVIPNAAYLYKVTAYDPNTYAESGDSFTAGTSNTALALTNAETVWFSDALPTGATANNDTDGWNWLTNSNPPPVIGTTVHQSSIVAGTHDHGFSGATSGLTIGTGDKLYTYVYLDTANMPSEAMLQFQDSTGSWEHRAYWGANSIALGTDGTSSRRNIGSLPSGGTWVRLEVPASQVGLEGLTITGVKYTLYNGRAAWDDTGKTGAPTSIIISAPSSLAASAASSSQINLTWTDNANNETGFKVYRSTDNVTFTLVQTIATANTQSYNDTGLSAGTQYWYKVTAYGTGESAYSNAATATTLATPAAPSGLGATVVSQTQVNLAWTDNSNNETGFKIDRATDSGFTQNLTTNTVGANVTTYSAAGLTANTTYYFRVRATNAAGDSANTTAVNATTLPNAPAAPSSLGASTVSSSQINLTWTDNSNNETGFIVDRATDSGFTQNLTTNTLSANVTTYSATGLTASTTYYFRVRATNTGGDSANTATANATTSSSSGVVAVSIPNNSFETNTGAFGTASNWTGGFAMPDGTFGRWNGEDGTSRMGLWWGNGTITQTLSATAIAGTTYTLTVGVSAYYMDQLQLVGQIQLSAGGTVIATASINQLDSGVNSVDFTATGVAPTAANGLPLTITFSGDNGSHMVAFDNVRLTASLPAAPTSLGASATSSSQINLTWTDNSSSESGFKIDRATDSGFTQNLTTTTVGANVTTYSATGLTANTTYYFRVRATNSIGDSTNSNTANATTLAGTPVAPSGLGATVVSGSQVNLTWTDNSSNETGFIVDRATDSGFTQNLTTNTVGSNVTTYSATGLTANTTYYFRVRSTNAAGDSANSNLATTVSVPNYSFETNTGAFGTAGNWTGGIAMPDSTFGHWAGEDGASRMGLWWGNGTISQTLATTAVAGASYTLTVGVSAYYGDQLQLVGQIQLSAGGTVIATQAFNQLDSGQNSIDFTATGVAISAANGLPLTITFSGDNGSHMVSFDNVRLTANLPAMPTGLTTSSTHSSSYSVQNFNLAAGLSQYGDVTKNFTTVPTKYVGSTWVQTAQADNNVAGVSNFLSFTVSSSSTVYVMYDDAITTKASWLTSQFTDTGDNIVTQEGTFSVYSKTVSAGTVTLGSNIDSGTTTGGMYDVLIVPLL